MPNPTIGMVAVCDQIYRDVATNKIVLAGMFTGDLVVQTFPAQISLAIYLELVWASVGEIEFDLSVTASGVQIGKVRDKIQHADQHMPAVIVLPASPFVIEQAGVIEMTIALNGGRRRTAFRKRLMKA
jgi:hypothetical protein